MARTAKAIDNPALAAIRAEARRLPGGFTAARGHVGEAMGADVGTPEGESRLRGWCDSAGLDAAHDGADGLRFTRRPDPNEHEFT